VIVGKVGAHLAGQVARSVAGAPPSRMPPAILYLHAGVHHAGAWLVFSTFGEAIAHYAHDRFAAELRRMVAVERREPVTVLRDRDVVPLEFADFVAAAASPGSPTFLRYAAALPTSPLALARRLARVTRFPGSGDRTGRSPPPPADR
jgi:hypothetical protein